MAHGISDLEAHLGYLLRSVSNHVSHSFALALETQGVTVAEWVMLRALYGEAPMPPSRLAETLGLTRGAISKLADRLVAKAFVQRTADARDGRMHSLSLTPAGEALVPVLARLADENDARFFGSLAPPERAAIETALRAIIHREGLAAVPVN
ncbi:MarR family winged helix-turn-helix transcriptional regulator [Sphingobium lignivorans]|uniref:DNA-binding MarR family transcriptional regulator n=1 Tax=Sphingobium lignivorans TaxID=2735886 RepID=A0ABR6NAT6_9SPHN|nr:MarR family transcriptional regulator [Sphingobium lignivorans]MBB5984373.1 DNA-binding MarR family transcriptional regulator [Sphingobium lignivorans]